MKTNNKGFSLVELIVVIAIMAILAAVAIPTFATFIGKAQVASDVDYLAQIDSAADLAFAAEVNKPSAIVVAYDAESNDVVSITLTIDDVAYIINKGADNDYSADGATDPAKKACDELELVVDMNYNFQNPGKTITDGDLPDGVTLVAAEAEEESST